MKSTAPQHGTGHPAAAPEFALVDQHGVTHRLDDYRGYWVVLYFYPRDDTPGCTREACAFRDTLVRFRRLGSRVLGVSLDDRERHRRFAEKHQLAFPLLADRTGQVAQAYGALWKLGPLRFARRRTFLIDPEGFIARSYRGLRPREHASRVLEDLERLRQAAGAAPERP